MSERRVLRALAFAAVVSFFAAGGTAAHHSLSGIYDTGANVTFEGVIREFHFVNPHPYLTVEISQDRRTQRWKMEMDNRGELAAIGMTSTTFRNGDRITVSGNPGLSGAKTLYIRRLDRPRDRFWYEQDETTPSMGFAKGKLGAENRSAKSQITIRQSPITKPLFPDPEAGDFMIGD